MEEGEICDSSDSNEFNATSKTIPNTRRHIKYRYYSQHLKKALCFRPDVLKYIYYLQSCLRRRKYLIGLLESKLKRSRKSTVKSKDASVQTCNIDVDNIWNIDDRSDKQMSISDQIKEAAECALNQTGMVYEETSGMYYDYSTGYYYNSETGLYYHSSTGCYYSYDKDQNSFTFHSHAEPGSFPSDDVHDDNRTHKKKRKHKKVGIELDSLTTNMASMSIYGYRNAIGMLNFISLVYTICIALQKRDDTDNVNTSESIQSKKVKTEATDDIFSNEEEKLISEPVAKDCVENIDGPKAECANSKSENEISSRFEAKKSCTESSQSDSESSSSDESVADQYPPCMRIIVNETSVNSIKIGSLFILTKEGGTLGREGSKHTIIIPEENISRHHLSFTYDDEKCSYFVKDVGSRNGTILNGKKISGNKKESDSVEVVHGSTLQLGSTKLLCHIHQGNHTCGHCEPGLLIKENEPSLSKSTYKPTNIKALHKKELKRLKHKYRVVPEKVEGTEGNLLPAGYEDKAKIRRDTVGSSHPGVKTEQASVETNINSDNKGFKMLEKMGWNKGEGLGRNTDGNTEPIALLSNSGTTGLGAGGMGIPKGAPSLQGSMSWKKQGVWLTTKQRFDKASTSTMFAAEESDDDEEESTATNSTQTRKKNNI